MATEYKLSYTASEINTKLGKIDKLAEKSEIPTKLSELIDDKGYLTEHQSLADYAKTADLGDLAKKDIVAKTDLASDVRTSLGKADTALQSYTETDPTVPAWAKAATKPTYTANEVGAGTFAGQVAANSSGQTPGTSLLRNSRLVSAETNPTVNGEICWTYE